MALIKNDKENYVSILSSDGTLRMVVPDGTEGAVKREYETTDGKKGTKTELVFNKLIGKITKIEFFDGDFGKLLQLTVDDGIEKPLILSVNTSQNFGEDIMKKLPNIDLNKEVSFSPYSFEDENGKVKKGVSIVQDGKKIQNFFYNVTAKKNCNGFPEPKGDIKKYSKDKWKIYFLEAREFLIEYTTKNFVKTLTADESFEKM